MSEERIRELETLLVAANAALELSTQANTKLKNDVAAAELATKRMRRNARSDESNLKSQLATAQRGAKAW